MHTVTAEIGARCRTAPLPPGLAVSSLQPLPPASGFGGAGRVAALSSEDGDSRLMYTHGEESMTDDIAIAIVGMAGRFPGAADVDAFWHNICAGVESVTAFSDEQLRQRGVPAELLADPDYVKAGIVFDGADRFDAEFFGYTPRDAEHLDPQQRIFLECAWTALEHAGYDPCNCSGSVGVYAGSGANLYLIRHVLPRYGLENGANIADLLGLMSANLADALCTRVAYKMNLRGPAVTVQTACSTSLMAVHMACQALLGYECDTALAGGVSLNLLQNGGYRYQPGAVLSADGHCRAFDADAAGTPLGSGAGIVVLKRLADALRDGDSVHALIKGSAANNDGTDKVGFTAPSVAGQARVIRAAQLVAAVDAGTIGYIEAQGMGSALGDPIEVAALTEAFGATAQRRQYCALGSVKTNIGHLDAAAGVAGLIKTVMALKHQVLPASLNFQRPNPEIDFANSPFYVNTQTKPWPGAGHPRRAGVSAFGIGGTNVHIIVEEGPAADIGGGESTGDDGDGGNGEPGVQVLPLSARDGKALRQSCLRLAEHLRTQPRQRLVDVAHTLQSGRRAFCHRAAIVAGDRQQAAAILSSPQSIPSAPVTAGTPPAVVFVFPEAGLQHLDMAAALYRRGGVFRRQIDRCNDILGPQTGLDLHRYITAAEGGRAAVGLPPPALAEALLFALSYALAQHWISLGVAPALMLGRGLGEYVAACVAEVFSLADTLRIVAARGRLLESLTEADLQALIAAVPRRAPRIPLLSGATGKRLSAEQASDPAYWSAAPRRPVEFAHSLSEIFSAGGRVLLEVGPGDSLTRLARRHPAAGTAAGIWATWAGGQQSPSEPQAFAEALAGLWTLGVDIDWRACHTATDLRRVPLPGYPFQRQRYWLQAPRPALARSAPDAVAAARPRPALAGALVAPSTDLEMALAQIWRERLGISPVGVNDNLFALGGDSLLAIQLLAQVRERFAASIHPSEFFREPTIAGLGSRLAEQLGNRPPGAVPGAGSYRIEVIPRTAEMVLSPIQRRLWMVDRLNLGRQDAAASAYNMSAIIELTGTVDAASVRRAVNALVARHEVLRTVYVENADGDPAAVINDDVEIDIALIDCRDAPGDEFSAFVENRFHQLTSKAFDLAAGPLLRAAIVQAKNQCALLLVVHHIVFDGWSIAVFAREFAHCYRAFAAGATPDLAPLPLQYADYAHWYEQFLQSAGLEDSRSFWRQYLHNAPQLSTVPADFPRPQYQSYEGSCARVDIGSDLKAGLSRLSQQCEVSLFALLTAAFLWQLHRMSGAADVVIGTDVAGRMHPDLEGLIGFFVNVVPLRSKLGKDTESFAQWLQKTQRNVLSALDHQLLPFDKIIDIAGAERAGGKNSLLQVLFVLQNTPPARFDIPGLAVKIIPPTTYEAKFDLAVFIKDIDGRLEADWVYSPHLYKQQTIAGMAAKWREILATVAGNADIALGELAVATAGRKTLAKNKLEKLNSLKGKKKPVKRRPESAVALASLGHDRMLPAVITPALADVDGAAWVAANRTYLDELASRHGGILFRDFGLRTPQEFELFAEAIQPGLFGDYGDLPKQEGGKKIYRSTPYPENEMILYHNESSHLDCWPSRQIFFCEQPAAAGGATPIVDGREVLQKLPAHTVNELEHKGLLYVRTFTPRLDVRWQDFYKTDDPAEVESKLTAAGFDWRWLDRNTLQTRSRSPAVIVHPVTGERVLFNQIQLHHPSCLDPSVRRDLVEMVGSERLPRQVYYGDGSPIDDATVSLLGRCYEQCAVRFDWRRGDVVLLDNMLVAHARDPFQGERKIVVAMGAMFDRASLGPVDTH